MAWGALLTLSTGFALASCTTILGDEFVIGGAQGGGTAIGGGGSGATGGSTAQAGAGAGSIDPNCGNGSLEAGESCDDGNNVDDDGCAANCGIEGTCNAPLNLAEASSTVSRTEWSIASNTGGESQVGLGACDGGPLGGGSDRIYVFTTTDVRDVTVTMNANFQGLIRLMSQPCDTTTEIAATGATDGCSTSASLKYNSLSAGSYFVVVDGQSETDEGSFDVTVQADCPSSYLALEEMRIGLVDRASFKHNGPASGCSVDLEGLTMRMAWSTGGPVDTALSGVIAPGDEIVVSELQADGDFKTPSSIQFSTVTGQYSALCRGACATAEDVIDVMAASEASAHPALPGGTSYSPEGMSGIVATVDDDHLSYQRAATQGASPNFLKSDWTIGPYLPTLFYDSFEDGNSDGWTLGNLNVNYGVVSCFNGQHGSKCLKLDGTTGAHNGYSISFPPVKPSKITFRVRSSSNASGFIGFVMFGNSNLAGNNGLAELRFGGDKAYLSVDGKSVTPSIPPNDWLQISYENINWQTNKMDIVFKNENGQEFYSLSSQTFWHDKTDNISRIHLYNTGTGWAYYDGFTFTE